MNASPKLHVVDESRFLESREGTSPNVDDLFRRYSRYVAAIAHRIVGDPNDAEDLVQDVFLDAHRGLKYYDDAQAAKGWLAVVTTRHAKRFLRKRKFKQLLGLESLSRCDQLLDKSATPEQAAVAASIYRILETLPVMQRVVWTLRYVQGETLDRTAVLAGCSRATAHRKIVAAQASLQEVLSDD